MSLNNPKYKMTSSNEFSDKNRICISDSPETVFDKVQRTQTKQK